MESISRVVPLPLRASLVKTTAEEDVWKTLREERRRTRRMIISVEEVGRVEDGATESDETIESGTIINENRPSASAPPRCLWTNALGS